MAENEENKETKKKKGGNSVILILVIFLLFLILAIGGGIAYMLLSSDDSENNQANNTKVVAKHKQTENEQIEDTKSPKKKFVKRKKNYTNLGTLFPLDKVIVNLQTDGSKKRYLRAEISLEFDNPAMAQEAEAKLPVIKDLIITILTSRTMEDVSTPRGKDRIKDEILSELSNVFVDGKVTDVFFTDFVIQ